MVDTDQIEDDLDTVVVLVGGSEDLGGKDDGDDGEEEDDASQDAELGSKNRRFSLDRWSSSMTTA